MRQQKVYKTYKIQRPTALLGSGPLYALAYDRSRRDSYNVLLTEEVESLFGERYKIYVEAYVDQQGNLNIIREIEEPKRAW